MTGEKTYVIKYKIYNYIQSNQENNIYVDVLPSGWETSIASSKINVSLPSDFKYTEMKGYAGSYGSSTEDNSKWTYDKANNTLSYEDTDISSNSGVTLMVKTPNGTGLVLQVKHGVVSQMLQYSSSVLYY